MRFAPGVIAVTEPLFVRGKQIVIEGAGCDEAPRGSRQTRSQPFTHLVGPRADRVVDFADARGLINYVTAGPATRLGGGMIRNLELSGFDAGIRGGQRDPAEIVSGGLIVEDVCITETGRGIAWSAPSTLSLKDVLIRDVFWTGVSISILGSIQIPVLLNFNGLAVLNAHSACLFFDNVGAVVTGSLFNFCGASGTIVGLNANLFIADTNIIGSHGPGVALSGGSAFITETFVREATGMGIFLHNVSHGDIEDVRVLDTKVFGPGPQAGLFGDGIAVAGGASSGVVWVTDSSIENSARAGCRISGAHVALGDSKIQCATFDLEGEPFANLNFLFTPLGGLKCGCPTASGSCSAVSVGLQAPGPVIPIP